jgi:mannose-6-phosphate isomerase
MSIVDKPWGHELIWAHTGAYVGKVIHIDAHHRLSLQYHTMKEETLYVIKGTLLLTHGDETLTMSPGTHRHIPANTVHRMAALDDDVDVIEVSTPQLEDVVRLEDDYGRG